MKKSAVVLLLVIIQPLAHANPLIATCNLPGSVSIPQGADATENEMKDAQAAIRKFVADSQAYLDCVDEALSKEDLTPDQSAALNDAYNNQVDQLNETTEQFNVQVRAFIAAADE